MHKIPAKIFIDGGDPAETAEAKKLLGYIDGQTTNPTLVSKNPEVQARLARGEKFTEAEAYEAYKKIVREISGIVEYSVSIETYSDTSTTAEQMFAQSREMYTWIPNAWIKFPTTTAGLAAAEMAVKEGMRVNMTLCFSQEQAAAVYTATLSPKTGSNPEMGSVFVSPFVGRLDDRGENGMDLIKNIKEMYRKGDGHVLTLTASVRTVEHLLYALQLGSEIITLPFKTFKLWADGGFQLPEIGYQYNPGILKGIPYQDISLDKPWEQYNIQHDLTDIGISKFSEDWNNLVR